MNINSLATADIDSFKLKWRWTDSSYLLMPEDDLQKITPLSPESASTVFSESLRLIKETEIETSGDRCKTTGDDVVAYLNRIVGEPAVLISWSPDCAVVTDPETFIKYWDDFCYPSSDDVSVWPANEAWFLQYFHYEEFSFVTL